MVQVCSACLSIPVERIEIKDTDTNKVPNSTPTVASISSDMYGMAIKVSIIFIIIIMHVCPKLGNFHGKQNYKKKIKHESWFNGVACTNWN